ncbi:MAG TPA: hypothetical protein VMT29_03195 [Steroidobacteraceae bacterium]|nr:hypothetical protein [Steroidobacteraceae bacterium]
MLRAFVLAIGLIQVAVGLWICGGAIRGPGFPLLISGILFIVGVVFERWRYQKNHPAGAQWESTGERFVDPTTGQSVEVLYDPRSGERRYASFTASGQTDKPA